MKPPPPVTSTLGISSRLTLGVNIPSLVQAIGFKNSALPHLTMGWTPEFANRAANGDLTVGIIGLGYVALPTAIGFHDSGFNVWGVDISQRTVDMVKRGENPTGDPDVNDIIPAPGSERWNITTSTSEAVPHCDVVLVTVPTPVTEDLKPDLSYVQSAGRAVFLSLIHI